MILKMFQDKKKQWRWHVKADNGRIVADSGEGYVHLADAVNGALIARIGIGNFFDGLKPASEESLPATEK